MPKELPFAGSFFFLDCKKKICENSRILALSKNPHLKKKNLYGMRLPQSVAKLNFFRSFDEYCVHLTEAPHGLLHCIAATWIIA